jgi:membrane protein implicated in regulation of membrane protease activity
MKAEYWLLVALGLAIAEVLAPGTFLIFFSVGALLTALAALVFTSFVAQASVFVLATVAILLAGNSVYRRFVKGRANGIGQGPVGEPGVVETEIVNGRGKVRVRDISWLATGPDLPVGTAIVVKGRQGGTLLEVAALDVQK